MENYRTNNRYKLMCLLWVVDFLEIFMGCLRKVEFGEEIYGLSRILWEKGILPLYGGFFLNEKAGGLPLN